MAKRYNLKPAPMDKDDWKLESLGTENQFDTVILGTTAKNIQFPIDIKGYACYVSSGTAYVKGDTSSSKEFLNASAVVDAGGGKVQLSVTNSGFASGDVVTVSGTTNYDGSVTLTSGTSSSVIEFTATYAAETPAATAYITGQRWAPFTAGQGWSNDTAVEADTTVFTGKTLSGTATLVFALRR